MQREQQVVNNSSMLGSSAGFTRKIKLASQRPGSRDQKTKTGEIFPQFQDPLAGSPYNLQVVNLYQDENAFISTMKAELLQLQEEINKLDLDGRIRNSDPRQEYRLQQLKKWVAQNSTMNFKQIIERVASGVDLPQLLSVLDAKSAEEGLAKLYKLVLVIDCMIIKVTEYEAIHMIKFDELFSQLCPNHNDTLQQLQINRFPVAFANLARMTELYQVKQGQERKSQPDQSSKLLAENQVLIKQIKQKDEQISELNKLLKQLQLQLQTTSKGSNNQNLIDSIKLQYEEQIKDIKTESERISNATNNNLQELQGKLQQKESQLNSQKLDYEKQITQLLQKHQYEVQVIRDGIDEKLKNQSTSQPQSSVAKDHAYYQRILDKSIADSKEKITTLETELIKVRNALSDKSAIIEGQQRELQQWKETIERVNQTKDEIYSQFQKRYSTKDEFANSYEAALKLEFEAMKKFFEQKIQKYQQDQEISRRDFGRQLNEIRIQLEREQETKKLLMNKLSLYS